MFVPKTEPLDTVDTNGYSITDMDPFHGFFLHRGAMAYASKHTWIEGIQSLRQSLRILVDLESSKILPTLLLCTDIQELCNQYPDNKSISSSAL